MRTLARIPKDEMPRERLQREGASALSLIELIAICLGSGSKGKPVLHLAEELLSYFGSIHALFEATIEELVSIKGIGYTKAIQLKAIFALAKRYTKPAGNPKYKVNKPEDIYLLIASEFQLRKREILMLLLRDVKGFVFHHEVIGLGTLAEIMIHPRDVFYQAISHHASSVIIAHNHPSGDPTPSKEDIELTKILYSSGRLMGIRLDDHLIVGSTSFVSLWQEGFIPHSRY